MYDDMSVSADVSSDILKTLLRKGGRRYVLKRLEFPHFCGCSAANTHEQILAVELPELSSTVAFAG